MVFSHVWKATGERKVRRVEIERRERGLSELVTFWKVIQKADAV